MQKLAAVVQDGKKITPISMRTGNLPAETLSYQRQPPILLPHSEKLVEHWTKSEKKGKIRGIFYDCVPGGTYSVVLGYTRKIWQKRMTIDTIRYKKDVPHEIGARPVEIFTGPNPEFHILKDSNVTEAALKFCAMNNLSIFTTSALLMKTIEGTYAKVQHPNGLIEILPLSEVPKSSSSIRAEKIEVKLRVASD